MPVSRETSLTLCADRLQDPSYGKTFKLDPNDFGLTLNLVEMGILPSIKRHMAPNAADLHVRLHKLNMYASLALLAYLRCVTLWLSLDIAAQWLIPACCMDAGMFDDRQASCATSNAMLLF